MNDQTIRTIGELGREMSDTTIRMHEAIAKKAGLSGTDHKYLGLLVRHGAMTAGELSKRTGLSTGAVTGLIDRFEKLKLVHRSFGQDDRRKVTIVPDRERAESLLGGDFALLQSRMLKLFSTFSQEEAAVIERYLRAVIAEMQAFTFEIVDVEQKP